MIECLSLGILFADVACTPIDHLPHQGELVPTDRVSLNLGGCAANVALDLAKLGVRTGISGCVGDDPFGDYIRKSLDVDLIDTSGVQVMPSAGTASTMMVNVKGEDRRFISTPGANTLYTVDQISLESVLQAKILYIGGYLVMPGLEDQSFITLLHEARKAGAKVVLDVVLFGPRNSWEALTNILHQVDVFLPNNDEAAVITGMSDPLDQANFFRNAGAKTVVITQGESGSLLVTKNLRLRAGVYPVDFVGGAGSGDAFDAGYIAGMLEGEDPAGCLRWGAALGASSVRDVSTTSSVFTRDEARRFMEENELDVKIEEF